MSAAPKLDASGVESLRIAPDAADDPSPFDGVPGVLRDQPQWVGWKRVERAGDATKVPFQVCSWHSQAKSNDPSTWSDFDDAVTASEDERSAWAGIGYVFSKDDPFVGIDLDGCIENGEVMPWAQPWLDKFAGCYMEISPSGTGIKIWARGKLDGSGGKRTIGGRAHTGIEVYDRGRFFCVTGDVFGDPVEDIPERQAAIDELYAWVKERPEKKKPAPAPAPTIRLATPGTGMDAAARARLCVMSNRHPDAVEGSNGHGVLYSAACAIVDGFGLGFDEGYPILSEFNQAKAVPPESDYQVRHKLESAIKNHPSPSLRLLNASRQPTNGNGGGKPSEPVIETTVDLDDIEIVDRWPKAAPELFHGLAGEFVQRIAPETEADPVATLFQVLAGFGNLIGRGPHFVVGSTRHHMVLNVAIVGATAVGRKGTSGDDAEFLLGKVDPDWIATRCRSGLATGEGLIHAVRDPKYRPPTKDEIKKGASPEDLVCEDEGVTDKRLHVVEPEMGALFKVMGRDRNTLSEVIRRTFDGKNLGNLSKGAGCTATNPHITIVGHVTKADIAKCLSETDLVNGFANRFLWVASRRSKMLPDGGDMYDLNLADLRARAQRVKDFAAWLGESRMTFDAGFRSIWRDLYSELSSEDRHVVASRSEPYVKRLACMYALLDETAVVQDEHLIAAVAAWDYVKQTIDYVFGAARRDPSEVKLIEALKAAPEGLTRKQINVDVFGGHLKGKEIATVLGSLLTIGAAHSRSESAGRGRPAERWFIGRRAD